MSRRVFVQATAAFVLGVTVQTTFIFFLAPVALEVAGITGGAPWVFGASALFTTLSVVPAGRLADRFTRRSVLTLGLAITALSAVPLVWAPMRLDFIVAAAALVGGGFGFTVIAFNAYVADLLSADRMVAGYGRSGTASVFASAAGPIAAAAIMAPAAPMVGIRAVALAFAAAAGVGAILSASLPSTKTATTPPSFNPNPPEPDAVRPIMILNLLLGMGIGMTAPYYALFFLGTLRTPEATWGLILAAGTAAGALGFWLAGRLVVGMSARSIILAGQTAHVLVTLAFLMPAGLFAMAGAYLLRTVLMATVGPLTNTIVMTRTAVALRGQALGYTNLALNAGWGAGAVAGGLLLPIVGGALFPIGAGIIVLGAVAGFSVLERRLLVRPRWPRRRLATPPAP